ncbi:MAG: dihydroorotase [Muribaculum sp.]|nr:dihydroorotase [Muribaculum sp.]
MSTILYNGWIINEGVKFKGYVAMSGQRISSVGHGLPPDEVLDSHSRIIDVGEAYILPGAIDDQVHFRDPGLTHKGDIATESAAALAGGVTSFMDMPNTKPPTVTLEALKNKMDRAEGCSSVNYAFFLGATNDNDNIEELLKCDYTKVPGVKLFLGSSTGNMLVDDETALNNIFSKVPTIIAVHSEDEATISRNKELAIAHYGNEVPVEMHPMIRSREACVVSTKRAIDRAEKFGSRLHVLHVSTAEEVEMFSNAPLDSKKITSEVCVHHLWFSDDDYERLGSRIKMNPAIKSKTDRDALRRGLVEGRIDIVATDHAPHLLSEKEGTALTAASGAPMVQFSLPLMLEMADMGLFTHELVVEKMCHAPARLFHIVDRGYIKEGYFADVTVVRPNSPYTVTDEMVLSRCGWTPLVGTTLHNRVVATYVNGAEAYMDGVVSAERTAMPLSFKN